MSLQQMGCPVEIDNSLGPWAGDRCRGGFDFTLLFEYVVLTIPLQCLFLLALAVRVLRLAKMDIKVVPSSQQPLKLCASVILLSLNAALLALWATIPSSTITRTSATIPAAALVFIASLGYCLLSWLEHERNIRPSFIISIYLSLLILLDTAQARTLWMLGSSRAIPIIFTSTLALRVVMLVLESTAKRNILVLQHQGYSREETSGTISRSVFFWLTPLFMKGYKRVLALEDLEPLDTNLRSELLSDALVNAWRRVPNKTTPGVLFKTWFVTFAAPVMAAIIPKLFQIGFTYSQPFLISAAIDLASLPRAQTYDNVGYGLIGAYAIVYTGIAISTGQYERRTHRAASMMRGSIISLIYHKSLRLDITSPNISPEGALTLMGTDAETIISSVIQLHEVWSGLLEIGIGVYLIYRQLGAACAMPLALAIVVLVGIGFLAVPTGRAQASWIQASQNRVTATSKTLGSIKWLKISGLNDTAFSIIRRLRSQELKVSQKCRMLLGMCLILLICTPILAPILSFATYAGIAAGGDSTLTISKAFVSFSLFILVNQPLSGIVISLPIIASSVTSFQRIQAFLNGKEREDSRLATWDDKKGTLQTTKSNLSAAHIKSGSNLEEEKPTDTEAHKTIPSDFGLGEELIASVQGKFFWAESLEPVIDIDDLSIYRRALTMVLGPVGCGKSTLLKSLLGELSSFQGTIRTNYSGVAYCGQSPWIPNETIRNVIVGSTNFDESWYHAVVTACALDQDMRGWPRGDETVAGTKGISMSGGQKHRLSIARAVYSRREFLIFDDVFSGLDSATEDLVFGNLFGKDGLLRAGNRTTIIASSDMRRVPCADQLVLLTKQGQIKENGTPGELNQALSISKSDPDWTEKTKPNAVETPERDAQPSESVLAKLETQADTARRLGDPAVYSFYIKAAGWFTLTIYSIAMAVFAASSVFPSIWLKWWAESNVANPNADLGKWLGVLLAFGVGSVLAIMVGAWQLFIVIINKTGIYFHDALLDTTSKASMSFHSAVDSGTTVNRFSQDLQLIDMELPAAALGVAVGVCFTVADFILISVSSKYMAIFLPFLILIFYVIQHFYLRTSRQMRLLDIEHKAPLYTQLIESLDGLITIRAFQWEDSFEKKSLARLDDSQRPSYLLYCLQRWLTFSTDMMIAFIAFILIIITTTLRDQIGAGYMGIALTSILAFSGTVKAIITSWVMLEVSLGAVARVKSFVQETKPEDSPDEPLTEPKSKDWPSQGAVEIREATASYASSGPVLSNITLSIKPGQRIAVCGRTGSGKSSLAYCLLRMMNLDGGSIIIDGIDISTLPHEYVRSKLVAVPQESYIFDGSVRVNVDPTETVPDEEIVAVLKKTQLWSKVEQRGGLGVLIHDKFFSQGEAQLLACARAMLRKSKVLILDELTSSLDSETSNIINDVLLSWFQGWTIIAIVHKLESILEYDRVAVLDTGRLVEYDEPRRLLERDGSSFRKLYEFAPRRSDNQDPAEENVKTIE